MRYLWHIHAVAAAATEHNGDGDACRNNDEQRDRGHSTSPLSFPVCRSHSLQRCTRLRSGSGFRGVDPRHNHGWICRETSVGIIRLWRGATAGQRGTCGAAPHSVVPVVPHCSRRRVRR